MARPLKYDYTVVADIIREDPGIIGFKHQIAARYKGRTGQTIHVHSLKNYMALNPTLFADK